MHNRVGDLEASNLLGIFIAKEREMSLLPRERLNVFISSAQKPERDINWEDLRKNVKEKLNTCAFINAFIIEDVCSTQPTLQTMQQQVENSDILIVLAYSEVRSGTQFEITTAMKKGVRILPYFIESTETDESVKNVKESIEKEDYCTYKKVKSIENIEEIIFNDVIEDCIRTKKSEAFYIKSLDADCDNIDFNQINEILNAHLPNKSLIKEFEKCYDVIPYLLEIGDIPKETISTPMLKLGENVQNWLVNGDEFGSAHGEHVLIEYARKKGVEKEWLSYRWKAIDCRMNDDIDAAIRYERKALEIAEQENAPNWIINDILIDCRNLEIEIENRQKVWHENNEAQKQIEESEQPIFMPVLDRYLECALRLMIDEKIEIETMPLNTIKYGSNLLRCIHYIQNYLFTSMYYGSITHLRQSREVLAEVLYTYGKSLRNNNLIIQSLKLYLLGGKDKQFKRILSKEWDSVYTAVVSNADSFWDLSKKADISRRDICKLAVIEKMGIYMTDSMFKECKDYIVKFAKNMYVSDAELLLKSIIPVVTRLDRGELVDSLINIINNRRYASASRISKILHRIDLSKERKETLQPLSDAIKNNIETLIAHGFSPQTIAYLLRSNGEAFKILENCINDCNISELERGFYYVNLEKDEWNSIVFNAITMERQNYLEHKEGTSHSFSVYNPGIIIADALKENKSKDTMDLIEKEYFPLAEQILSSNIATPTKYRTLDALSKIIIMFEKNGRGIPDYIVNCINDYRIDDEMDPFAQITPLMVGLKHKLLLMLCKGISEEELITYFLINSNASDKERIVAIESLRDYLIIDREESPSTICMIEALLKQYSNDGIEEVRYLVIDCIENMSSSETFRHGLYDIYYEMICDPSATVRIHLAKTCLNESNSINQEVRENVLSELSNDASFVVRNIVAGNN